MRRDEFEKLAPDLRKQMLRVGLAFFGNRHDAEDVAQDGLIRLWTYCERLDVGYTLEPLAVKVAKNVCVDLYKRRRVEGKGVVADAPAQKSYNADAHLQTEESIMQIDCVLRTLRPYEERLVRQRHLEDKSTDEIAEETGMPKASVKSILSMARAKLKKRFRQ